MTKPIKKKTGTYCRRRGHNFEREVAILLRDLYPKAARGLQYRAPDSCDVEYTDYRIECSRGNEAIQNKWVQVLEEAKKHGDTRPCVVVKKWDRTGTVVLMNWDMFYDLIKMKKESQCQQLKS